MRSGANYFSTDVAISTTETEYTTGDSLPKAISGIQNNTTEIVEVKFNGGNGVLKIPIDGYFEPFSPIIGTITLRGVGTGNCCILG